MRSSGKPGEFYIRSATAADVPVILRFIRKLAGYERLSREVVANEKILRKTLFGRRRVAEVAIGYFDDQPVGFVLFFHNYSTFLGRPGIYIEDLFVDEFFRRRGFGGTLLRYVAMLAKERRCGRLEWSVLNWNRPAINFYRKLGAVAMNEWTVFRVSGAPLIKLGAGNDEPSRKASSGPHARSSRRRAITSSRNRRKEW